jgi:hypothetical protein
VPAANRPFCGAVNSSAPPSSVIGLLTIGGAAAPAGTVVTLTFDGVPGPTATTTAAGGYRVDFPGANDECANRPGAAIAVVVNGQSFPTGAVVGSTVVRKDIAVP